MRKLIPTGLAFATGLLAALHATPAPAQTTLAMLTDPGNTSKAVELERKAESLYSNPSRYATAARLHLRAAGLRTADDPLHVRDLTMAGRLYYYAGKKAEAFEAMERAADAALAAGDVVTAANSYIDASHVARELSRGEDLTRLVERARLLSTSPLLSASDRASIQGRLEAE